MTSPTTVEHHKQRRSDVSLALAWWTPRHVLVALVAALTVAVIIGLSSVLIPNSIFAREIPPVWWNYPVWLATSVFSGMLVATYVRTDTGSVGDGADTPDRDDGPEGRGSSRLGLAGGVLAWFAVGCPVCNKLALLALGYSGAITWFTPIQPYLALGGLVLTGIALFWRLRGQVSCPMPEPQKELTDES